MAITIKSAREIELMRESNKRIAEVHKAMEELIKPGITTWELDEFAERMIRKMGCTPNFKGYSGYPATVCCSVNDEVVHGIPSKTRILQDGDIISLDMGLIYNGYHADAAGTLAVGEVAPEVLKLMEVTKQSFFEGIKYAVAGHHLHEISNAIDDYVSQFGYGIVYSLMGHGIGKALHESPEIPNFRQRTRGPKLRAGMTLAIEPMITMGRPDVAWLDDEWTVVTEDGSWAAHYENTILITDGEPEILTLY